MWARVKNYILMGFLALGAIPSAILMGIINSLLRFGSVAPETTTGIFASLSVLFGVVEVVVILLLLFV